MKKSEKIGALVCMLLLMSFLPAADIVGTNVGQTKVGMDSRALQNDSADIPVWENGNYWIYDIGLSYEATGASAEVTITNLHFEVTNIGSESYTLTFNGEIIGSVVLAGIIEGVLQNTVINGKMSIGKSDLAMERLYDTHIEGNIKRQFVTNSFWVDLEMKQNVTPVVSPYDFPIDVNETWSVPLMTFWIYANGEVSLAVPYPLYYDFPVYIEEHNLACTGKETVNILAGKYNDAFHVSGSTKYEFWYSPTARNVVKAPYNNIRMWYNESLYWDLNELGAELTETNVKPPNEPPHLPSNPNPANNSTDVNVNTDLSWTGGDPDGDEVVYDVYFGTTYPPPNVEMAQPSTTYNLVTLDYNTTYYWRIDAWDSIGFSTTGPDWTFKTGISTNNPPNKPEKPSGPTSGIVGTTYSYSSYSTDSDGDQIYYLFDWGDGSDSGWLGPYDSGKTVNVSYVWDSVGTYGIKVKAKDITGAESEWSDSLAVSMPKAYYLPMQKILEMLSNWFMLMLRDGMLTGIFNL